MGEAGIHDGQQLASVKETIVGWGLARRHDDLLFAWSFFMLIERSPQMHG